MSVLSMWDRRVVLALLDRIELVTGRPWPDAIASRLHVSEFILYGVFVDGVLGASANVVAADSMLCHSYWDSTPLGPAAAAGFVRGLSPDDCGR
jgi:hypothetical protein